MAAGSCNYQFRTGGYSFLKGVVGSSVAGMECDQNVHFAKFVAGYRPMDKSQCSEAVVQNDLIAVIDQFFTLFDPRNFCPHFSDVSKVVIGGERQISLPRAHIDDPQLSSFCELRFIQQIGQDFDVLIDLPPFVTATVKDSSVSVSDTQRFQIRC